MSPSCTARTASTPTGSAVSSGAASTPTSPCSSRSRLPGSSSSRTRSARRPRAPSSRNAGRHARYVGEPIWASRTGAEIREATRHESLINLAFADADADILCPYQTAALSPDVVSDAARTHPLLLADGRLRASARYAEPFQIPVSCSAPLPPPPQDAMSFTYRTDLSAVRNLVFTRAVEAGLPNARANDLVLAVSEAAANTLRHTQSHGTLSIWHDNHEIICEIHDEGVITDPLAGRRRPAPDATGGHGLWLVHQVCDLVEMRSDATGTTIRMHMSLKGDGLGGLTAASGRRAPPYRVHCRAGQVEGSSRDRSGN